MKEPRFSPTLPSLPSTDLFDTWVNQGNIDTLLLSLRGPPVPYVGVGLTLALSRVSM